MSPEGQSEVGPQTQESGKSLEAGKGKEMDASLEPPEGMLVC